MPVNVPDNEIMLRCACGHSDHTAFLIHEPDDTRGNNLKGEHDDWYLSVRLDHFHIWKRLRMALRYAFAPHTITYGTTAELVLRSEDVDKLCEFIVTRRLPGALIEAAERRDIREQTR